MVGDRVGWMELWDDESAEIERDQLLKGLGDSGKLGEGCDTAYS